MPATLLDTLQYLKGQGKKLDLPLKTIKLQTLFTEYELKNSEKNKLDFSDKEFHDWYRFVLSYPPHLVRQYLKEFNLKENDIVLDPFCGTGTTLVEAKLQNIPSIGIEANPFAHFASSVKIDWHINASALLDIAKKIKDLATSEIEKQKITDIPSLKNWEAKSLRQLSTEQEKLMLKDSLSPLPLHKCLTLLYKINDYKNTPFHKYLSLALAKSAVFEFSNLRFGPEVGVGKLKQDSAVILPWFKQVSKIAKDIEHSKALNTDVEAKVILSDSRNLKELLNGHKITAVNTRGVYKGDTDDEYVKSFPEIQRIADEIEQRRIELGKTSGFEKLYHKVAKLYFGGMAKHLIELQSVLRPGAYLAYVVGDQASYLRVMIRTGHLIAEIAQTLGYELVRIDLFRTRFSTATKTDLNEEVVILRWRG